MNHILGAKVNADGLPLGNHEFIGDAVLGVAGEAELRVLKAEPPLLTNDIDNEHLLFDGLGVIFLPVGTDARVPSRELRGRHGFVGNVVRVPNRAEGRNGDEDQRSD